MSINKAKPKLVALKPPPKERAIEDSQKKEVLSALMAVWKKYPYLRLGQLLFCVTDNNLFNIEDFDLVNKMSEFNPEHDTECGVLSHSRTVRCTLEKGHDGDRHFNKESSLGWRRF